MPGLRETKKARTRRRIADEATRLFVTRGFEAVTVAEIAEAAEVSKMTVFNHFPRKEDMLFDRIPEATALLTDAVRGRPPGTHPVEALRALALELTEQRHPFSGIRDGTAPFGRLVIDSPALLARLREVAGELESHLAGLCTEAGLARPGLAAALTIAAYRTLAVDGASRLLAGQDSADFADEHIADLHAAFDALGRAVGT